MFDFSRILAAVEASRVASEAVSVAHSALVGSSVNTVAAAINDLTGAVTAAAQRHGELVQAVSDMASRKPTIMDVKAMVDELAAVIG
jgi:hypothetical protein